MLAIDKSLSANRCEVRPSIISDVYLLSDNVRTNDRNEVEALGTKVKNGLRTSFRHAILRKTYFVDGEIAAMSGLCGAMLGDIGEPYLLTTPTVERVPVVFVKQARLAIAEMMQHKLRLEGYVDAKYLKACRLLEVVGFTVGKPEKVGLGMFRKFTMMRDY